MRIITLSREFGSGGREVAKRMADELNIAYYDREIITAIAERTSMDAGYVKHILDNKVTSTIPIHFSQTFSFTSSVNGTAMQVLSAQNTLIKELAQKGDCIIVGRSADAILSDMKPLKIFVYADMDYRKERCRRRAESGEQLSDRQLERKIKEVDRARAERYMLASGEKWGDKGQYDLCVNTTGLEIKHVVPALAQFAKLWFEQRDD